MKKKLLVLISAFALCVPMFAAFYMCVKLQNDDILKFDVEEVENVFYEKILGIDSDSTSSMNIIMKNGESKKYQVNDVKNVFYEKQPDIQIPDSSDIQIPDSSDIQTPDSSEVDTSAVTINLSFEFLSDSTVSVKGGCGEVVTIPESVEIDGSRYAVTSISNNAFSECFDIKKIIIPSSVTVIGEEAFMSCMNLTTVEIPESVTQIKDNAFYYCKDATIVIDNLESNIKIGSFAFYGCKSVSYTIQPIIDPTPDGITVDTSATPLRFWIIDDSSVGVDFSSSYEEIRDSVVIPDFVRMGDKVYAVTNIGTNAFAKCNMTSLYIPAGISLIGDTAISRCKYLTTINVAEGNKNYSSANGILYNKDKTTLIAAASGIVGEISIDTTVEVIKYEAFYMCDSLTKVYIPENVTTIESLAFYGCNYLNVVVDNSEYEMEVNPDAFTGCKSVVFTKDDPTVVNATETNIKFEILSDSTAEVTKCNKSQIFGAITIPEKVRINKKVYVVVRIGDSAFEDCNILTSVKIPSTITSIGNNAFYFCSGLTKIDIPENNITSIGEMAFSDCSNLAKLAFSENVTSIGLQAFAYCTKLDLVINNLEENIEIGDNAFYECKSVKFAE